MAITPARNTESPTSSAPVRAARLRPDDGTPRARPTAAGKFLYRGDDKLYARGVTYGPFRPGRDGSQYPDADVVERDFVAMSASAINALRTYTVPPRWLLDLAAEHGLCVLVGLPWEQHVAFASDRNRMRSIEQRVRAGARDCARHPALLGYAIGNEIPAQIVRWHGRRRIERFLARLYDGVKEEDPDALVTYVNYPSTEYLELPFLDFVCFNVFLEARDRLEVYLARLQNLTGDRPLLLTEVGLDSTRHGEGAQARSLEWQLRAAFGGGCAGAFAFAWTDEWHRGGHDIEDWDFGLVTRDRRPKAALGAAGRAFADAPLPAEGSWPRVSAVVCTHDGQETLGECLDGLERLEYPDYEVIVVDDGSTQWSPALVDRPGVRLVRTDNRGLAAARNAGLEHATGEIVAYIDDDAWPDPHWLHYLVTAFAAGGHCAVGGPNIPPPDDGPIAQCVANAPGGPIHVLVSDTEAEHIPGCNMAVRRDALEAIGGFDPVFIAAGDDVDVCWRLRARGWRIGFAPGAVVWHHRRNSLRDYWRQQRGYGKAEALLEDKWPERYNRVGHVAWAGRLYGRGLARPLLAPRRWRVYYGTWGSGPFQRLYHPADDALVSLPLMPEWYLLIAALAVLSALAPFWPPLLAAVPLLAVATLGVVGAALANAARARFPAIPPRRRARLRHRALTALLYLLQPLARLRGRVGQGLTPWRGTRLRGTAPPIPGARTVWSESWLPPEERVRDLERRLRANGARVARGGEFERWDLEAGVGVLGSAQLRAATEEHGAGRQLLRLRFWPKCSRRAAALALLAAFVAVAAARATVWPVVVVVGGFAVALAAAMLAQCAGSVAAVRRAAEALADEVSRRTGG
jgi:GT2 family glycosyltransferase